MAKHVDRAMIELGVAPKVNGPLFLRIRSAMAPYMVAKTPQTLMALARQKIRKALLSNKSQPIKRLQGSNQSQRLQLQGSVTAQKARQLHLPQKLKQFITMGE